MTKITDLTEYTGELAGDDLVEMVDVSDTTDSAQGSSRKVAAQRFFVRERPITEDPSTQLGAKLALPLEWATQTLLANRWHAMVIATARPITITDVIARVETAGAASTTMRIAIYTPSTTNSPNGATLVSDLGTVAVDSTGAKTITGLSVALPAGAHFIMYGSDGTPTLKTTYAAPINGAKLSNYFSSTGGFLYDWNTSSASVNPPSAAPSTMNGAWMASSNGGTGGAREQHDPFFWKWTE